MEIERKIITLKTVHNDKEILEIKENIYTICWRKNYEIQCYEIWKWLEVERKLIIKIIMIKKCCKSKETFVQFVECTDELER